MRRLSIFHFVVLLAIGLIACGDSGDEDSNQPAKPTTQSQEPGTGTEVEVKREAVDFAAEEAAIRELFTAHAAAVSERDLDQIMDYWLKLDKPELFMAWNFWNAFTRIETWKGVKESFSGTFEKFKNQMTVTITEVGVDAKGKEGTLRASYNWLQAGNLVAAFRKDSKGQWKILAIDFSNKDLIKWIETP